MHNYIHLKPGGKKTRNGEMYYEEFKSEFWQKPGKYYLSPFIYLNFIECNLKFPNNILETEYDRMHKANQAVQAILSLSSAARSSNPQSWDNEQVLTADSAWGRMEENIVQDVNSQEEDEEEYLNNVNNQEADNQDISSQGEDEEGYLNRVNNPSVDN